MEYSFKVWYYRRNKNASISLPKFAYNLNK
jgi:hypothetical protein